MSLSRGEEQTGLHVPEHGAGEARASWGACEKRSSPSGAEGGEGDGARAQLSVSSQKCKTVLGPQFPHLQHGDTSTYVVEL